MHLNIFLFAFLYLIVSCKSSDFACKGKLELENGFVKSELTENGFKYYFNCNENFKLVGENEIVCKEGIYSKNLPICAKSGCFQPLIPQNGYIIFNEDESLAIFNCDHGFELKGDSVLFCNGNNWNTTTPFCIEGEQITISKPKEEEKEICKEKDKKLCPPPLQKISAVPPPIHFS